MRSYEGQTVQVLSRAFTYIIAIATTSLLFHVRAEEWIGNREVSINRDYKGTEFPGVSDSSFSSENFKNNTQL
jgi:hypothetical protein